MRYINLLSSLDCVENLRKLGWDTICVATDYKDPAGFRKFYEKIGRTEDKAYVGAVVSRDLRKNARKSIDQNADLVIADARGEDAVREASQIHEVDLIVNPELGEARDKINQKSSGLDSVSTAYMKDRDIGYCINMDNILDFEGQNRIRLLARIRQNIKLAKSNGVLTVLSCGYHSPWNARSPADLAALAESIGLNKTAAKKSVSEYPTRVIEKIERRNDPDTIIKGLKVLDWGSQQRKHKRKYGWY